MPEQSNPRGRPRTWEDTQARQEAYRRRQREKVRLIDARLHAVRNAHWDDRQLQQRINDGDDAQVLQALIEHYQQRHWCLVPSNWGGQPADPASKGGNSSM